MLRSRAMRLLERPRLIITRTSRSRAVRASLTRLPCCAGRPRAEAPRSDTSSLHVSVIRIGVPHHRAYRAASPPACVQPHELHYAEPPSNRSSVERNLTEICVLARALAELVTPPAMRHHAKTSATSITDLMFAVLSHDTLVLRVDT